MSAVLTIISITMKSWMKGCGGMRRHQNCTHKCHSAIFHTKGIYKIKLKTLQIHIRIFPLIE